MFTLIYVSCRFNLYLWLSVHEFDQTPGDSEGQGSLMCCSSWGCRVRHDLVTDQRQQFIFPSGMVVKKKKKVPVQEMQGIQVLSLGGEISLEEEMVKHSSILAC